MTIPKFIGRTASGEPFALPEDAVTQGFAILGKRGRGKSVMAGDIIETIARRGHRFVIMDPPDAHWGIRYGVDENGEPAGLSGIEVLLVGGEHGDVPLDPHGGRELARIIVEGDIDCVISMKKMGYTEQQRFAADFEEELFLINRTARFLLWEEAHNFLPQNLKFEEQKRVLYASEKIVQEGRGSGLGFGIVSQRPASVNKSILEQTDNFVALGMIGPNDLEQVEHWFKHQVRGEGATLKDRNANRQEKLQALIDDLATMEVGQCWFLSPVWMRCRERLSFRERTTYHSGRTPKPGEKPPNLKKISVGDAVERLKKIFESKKVARQQEVADLNEAKKRIRELEGQIATINKAKPTAPAAVPTKVSKVAESEIRRVLQSEIEPWRKFGQQVRRECVLSRKLLASVGEGLMAIHGQIAQEMKEREELPDYPVIEADTKAIKDRLTTTVVPRKPAPIAQRTLIYGGPLDEGETSKHGLPPGELAVLRACAQYPNGLERNQLTVLSGYKKSSRDAYIQRLRTKGYVDDRGGRIFGTQAGLVALGPAYEPLPAPGEALQRHWLAKLPEGEAKVLKILIAAQGKPVARESLDDATGYKKTSRDAYLQRLTAKELVITEGRGLVAASPTLLG